jgi:hypothetical protein
MDLVEHIDVIRQKLGELRHLDRGLQIFEAITHAYHLNPPLTEHQLYSFEMEYEVILPAGYRAFLSQIGNGGAGPYYGLWSLQESCSARQSCLAEDRLFLAHSFPPWRKRLAEVGGVTHLSEFWRKCEEDSVYRERVMEALSRWDVCDAVRGSLPICEYGSGIEYVLVISGSATGEVWVDNGAFDFGLMPTVDDQIDQPGLDFLNWYENWLDESISELR